ncbi:hypothetical protein TKK_0003142 [Trichogramma kaykai]
MSLRTAGVSKGLTSYTLPQIHGCGTRCYRSNREHNIERHEGRFHSFKHRLCKFCNKVYRTKFDYYKHVHEAHKDRCPIALHLSDKCWGIRKMNQEPEVPPTPPSSPDDADAPTTLPIKKRLSLEFHWRRLPIKKRLSLEFHWRPSGFAPYSMAKANNFNA